MADQPVPAAELVRVGDQLARMVEEDAGHLGPEVCGRHAREHGKALEDWCSYCHFVVLWRKLRAEYVAEDGAE